MQNEWSSFTAKTEAIRGHLTWRRWQSVLMLIQHRWTASEQEPTVLTTLSKFVAQVYIIRCRPFGTVTASSSKLSHSSKAPSTGAALEVSSCIILRGWQASFLSFSFPGKKPYFPGELLSFLFASYDRWCFYGTAFDNTLHHCLLWNHSKPEDVMLFNEWHLSIANAWVQESSNASLVVHMWNSRSKRVLQMKDNLALHFLRQALIPP